MAESLNHVSLMHSGVYLVATINCFAVLWVGSPAKSYTEHVHEATA